jgi:Na+-driven multidrug efflux pump
MEQMNIYYMEKAPIPKAVASMSIPMILGMFVGVIQNITDTFFIGQLNDTKLVAAAMLALPMFTIFMAVSNIFGIGCGTYISRLLGEKDYDICSAFWSIRSSICDSNFQRFSSNLLCMVFYKEKSVAYYFS